MIRYKINETGSLAVVEERAIQHAPAGSSIGGQFISTGAAKQAAHKQLTALTTEHGSVDLRGHHATKLGFAGEDVAGWRAISEVTQGSAAAKAGQAAVDRARASTPQRVLISSLTVGQPKVFADVVKKYIDNPAAVSRRIWGEPPKPEGSVEPVVVIKAHGKSYCADGHHRAVAALLRGETHVLAHVAELEALPAVRYFIYEDNVDQ